MLYFYFSFFVVRFKFSVVSMPVSNLLSLVFIKELDRKNTDFYRDIFLFLLTVFDLDELSAVLGRCFIVNWV